MKINASPDFTGAKDLKELIRYVSKWAAQVTLLLNGGARVTENLSVSIVEVTFAGDDQKKIVHGLGRVPQGFVLVDTATGGFVRRDFEMTATEATLYSSTSGMRKILFF